MNLPSKQWQWKSWLELWERVFGVNRLKKSVLTCVEILQDWEKQACLSRNFISFSIAMPKYSCSSHRLLVYTQDSHAGETEAGIPELAVNNGVEDAERPGSSSGTSIDSSLSSSLWSSLSSCKKCTHGRRRRRKSFFSRVLYSCSSSCRLFSKYWSSQWQLPLQFHLLCTTLPKKNEEKYKLERKEGINKSSSVLLSQYSCIISKAVHSSFTTKCTELESE